MKTRSCYLVGSLALLVSGGAVVVSLAGPLDPPAGPVAPTYKTLQQVEPRTDVATLAGTANARHIIVQPGAYYLTANVVGGAGLNGIVINADNVTLDLNGFAVIGAASSGDGITLSTVRSNVTIRNGVVRGWTADGVDAADDNTVIVDGLIASNNGGMGIAAGDGAVIKNCTSRANTGIGIRAAEGCSLQACTSSDNGGDGFFTSSAGATNALAGVVNGCSAVRNGGNGFTSSNSSVLNCNSSFNNGNGFAVGNSTVSTCWARDNGLNGFAGGGHFSGCATRSNAQDGFHVGEGTQIEDCLARGNTGDGIDCDKEVTVRNCHVEDNSLGAGGSVGIRLVMTDCRVEGNTVLNNLGTGILCAAGATGNVIVGNRASGNGGAGNFSIVAGNFLGTVVASEAAMNAAANALVNIAY